MLLTFAQIDTLLIEHRRAEEARNAPAAVAVRALDDLREALGQMSPDERYDVMNEVCEMIDELKYGQAWRTHVAAREVLA